MKTLNFDQSTPSATWTINHGFGTKVVTEVAVINDGNKEIILPLNITAPDDNTIVITFSQSLSGTARVLSIAI